MENYDAVVIGTGQAGKPLAFELAEEGWEVAVVERDEVGGSCVNYGCTPTKTLVASGKVSYLAGRSEEYGIETGPVRTNMEEVIDRKRSVVEMFRSGSEQALNKSEQIDFIRGEARFVENKTIDVNGDPPRTLTAERIFINTGQVPRIPDVKGIDSVPYLTNESILELEEVPEHLVIVGGGYIGLEFGQMFRRFGSDVTILQRGDQIAPLETPDIAEELQQILEEDGVDVRVNTDVCRVSQEGDRLSAVVEIPEGEEQVTGSHLLLAAGRVPATDDLGLEQTGIRTNEKGAIQVNDRLETDVPGVFGLGDVKGGPAFTHISYDDYRVVRDNLLHGKERTIRDRMVPYTIFTDPELGRIGLNEAWAQEQGQDYRLASMSMERVARAIERSETRGKMKVLVAPDSDEILGASILGIDGGEIASMIQIAMMGDVPYQTLRDGIFSHPTLAESFNNLFASLS